ncbi:hypothetical protein BXY39_0634 [Eilatimonas milleporae]|uniref:Uncharacterized protein n=1 Tax=Eilatimonas milleporae TaxID=911205 RepID=A0A3M0D7A4_9PROT|nr:hypothetical protein BXY39_0634 [Eilatimonas milleporae]
MTSALVVFSTHFRTGTSDVMSQPRHGGAIAPVVRAGLDLAAAPYAVDPVGRDKDPADLPSGERYLIIFDTYLIHQTAILDICRPFVYGFCVLNYAPLEISRFFRISSKIKQKIQVSFVSRNIVSSCATYNICDYFYFFISNKTSRHFSFYKFIFIFNTIKIIYYNICRSYQFRKYITKTRVLSGTFSTFIFSDLSVCRVIDSCGTYKCCAYSDNSSDQCLPFSNTYPPNGRCCSKPSTYETTYNSCDKYYAQPNVGLSTHSHFPLRAAS